MLDEPTSGLDSFTALRIIKMLRVEAQRGMSFLMTLHQPAAEILFQLDRVILLSEGYTIYNGPPGLIKEYFKQFGLKMNQFSNPADKLSNIASEPRNELNKFEDITIIALNQACSKQLT
jgi:ATP-binding cassette, subfamily G (WHITE), eye pigment precursor transporter